jgi:hypothetical protein
MISPLVSLSPKNKEDNQDIQSCTNYCEIKLISNFIKVCKTITLGQPPRGWLKRQGFGLGGIFIGSKA